LKFTTALRAEARRKIEAMESADIVVGIPAYNNSPTIEHVVTAVSKGLKRYFNGMRSVIVVSDGGSVDDTREQARNAEIEPWVERVVSIYRGVSGKGTAIRQIFEVAGTLGARACAMVDSDLRSITPEWIRNLLRPVTEGGYDYVTPYYNRYKYDGTITNNIVYFLTRSLYGKRVRQPIGGDFAFSPKMIKYCKDQDVWQTDVGRFGIDIWLTTTAIVQKFKICQVRLGAKVHDVKDPVSHLGPMFRQVVDTMMVLMDENAFYWMKVEGSTKVPILGKVHSQEPAPFDVDHATLVHRFKIGYQQFSSVWKGFLAEDNYKQLQTMARLSPGKFVFPDELWCKVLFDYAVAFHSWEANRHVLTTLMTPLYYARIASFINATKEMSNREAEQQIEKAAETFEDLKPYLVERWRTMSEELAWREPGRINT